MKLTTKDKILIRTIADHFRFSLGDAFEVFKYAEYKDKSNNSFLKKIWSKKGILNDFPTIPRPSKSPKGQGKI